MRDEAALLPGAAGHERAEAGDLRIAVELVEAAEDRMVLRDLDDLAIGKHLLHLAARSAPTRTGRGSRRTSRCRRAAGTRAGSGIARRLQPQVARLDEVDPRILEQPRVVERQHDRILDLDRGRRLDAARQVLLRRRRVDDPRLAVEVLLDARAFGRVVVLDADEAPLQAGEAVVGRRRQLRVDARLQRRHQREQRVRRRAAPARPACGPVTACASASFSSSPARARSSARFPARPASASAPRRACRS